jgi:hypothetical protein
MSRVQFMSVCSEECPWVEDEDLSKLFSGFDPANTGFVKFIKITASLLLGLNTASYDLFLSSKFKGAFALTEIHKLYAELSRTNSKQPGITADDIHEIFECCVVNEEDVSIVNEIVYEHIAKRMRDSHACVRGKQGFEDPTLPLGEFTQLLGDIPVVSDRLRSLMDKFSESIHYYVGVHLNEREFTLRHAL